MQYEIEFTLNFAFTLGAFLSLDLERYFNSRLMNFYLVLFPRVSI